MIQYILYVFIKKYLHLFSFFVVTFFVVITIFFIKLINPNKIQQLTSYYPNQRQLMTKHYPILILLLYIFGLPQQCHRLFIVHSFLLHNTIIHHHYFLQQCHGHDSQNCNIPQNIVNIHRLYKRKYYFSSSDNNHINDNLEAHGNEKESMKKSRKTISTKSGIKMKEKKAKKAKKTKSITKNPKTTKSTKRKKTNKISSQDEPVYFWSNPIDLCTVHQYKGGDSVSSSSSSSLSPHTIISLQNGSADIIQHQQNDENDTFVNEIWKRKMIHFTIRGNPLPLQRHRTYRNFVYNPSAKKQQQFYETVLTTLPSICFGYNYKFGETTKLNAIENNTTSNAQPIMNDNVQTRMFKVHNSSIFIQNNFTDTSNQSIQPFFKEDEYLKIKLIFHLKRPKNHFISSKPGPGRIRPQFQSSICQPSRVDVDNLAKFVLDSLNGIVYVDDRQVVELHVKKVLDNEEDCLGKTQVWITRLKEETEDEEDDSM